MSGARPRVDVFARDGQPCLLPARAIASLFVALLPLSDRLDLVEHLCLLPDRMRATEAWALRLAGRAMLDLASAAARAQDPLHRAVVHVWCCFARALPSTMPSAAIVDPVAAPDVEAALVAAETWADRSLPIDDDRIVVARRNARSTADRLRDRFGVRVRGRRPDFGSFVEQIARSVATDVDRRLPVMEPRTPGSPAVALLRRLVLRDLPWSLVEPTAIQRSAALLRLVAAHVPTVSAPIDEIVEAAVRAHRARDPREALLVPQRLALLRAMGAIDASLPGHARWIGVARAPIDASWIAPIRSVDKIVRARVGATTFEVFGQLLTVPQMAELAGVTEQSVRERLAKGLSPDDAVTTQKRSRTRR